MKQRKITGDYNTVKNAATKLLLLAVFLLAISNIVSFKMGVHFVRMADADKNTYSCREYGEYSYVAETGDTVSGLAKKFLTPEYHDVRTFRKAFRKINKIYEDDDIIAGKTYKIPYFHDTEDAWWMK